MADEESRHVRVIFTPSGKQADVPADMTVLQAARKLGVDLDSVCGGRGICGRCQIVPSYGHFAKFSVQAEPHNLTPFSAVEARYQQKRGLAQDRRLGCSCRLIGDMVIDVPETSQLHKQVVRKLAEQRDIVIDPLIRLYYVEVDQPDMEHPSGDLERLYDALFRQWSLEVNNASAHIPAMLQAVLRKSDWCVTVAVRRCSSELKIIAIWPGLKERILGVAVDVGSTTMSAHLCDLLSGEVIQSAGSMNPQIRFGEDLMSRVSYAMMNPGGEQELTAVVQDALGRLIIDVCEQAACDRSDVLECVIVGNPVMHHLLLGWSPVELGWAPFALVSNQAQDFPLCQLGSAITDHAFNPGAHSWVLPLIAGHVGADAAAVILSEAPQMQDAITLIVDIGTNAEIILGSKARLLACSSPTGPALEGAQISSGQRAAAGAIERVRIDPDTLEPRFKVIGCDRWSNEDGFDDLVAATGVTGICGSGIIEVLAELYLTRIIDVDGRIAPLSERPSARLVQDGRTWCYVLNPACEAKGWPEIRITQNDVRAIQLAKAALYAGAQLLVDRLGQKPERIILAGAFGSHIDPKSAMILGMIPDCDLKQVRQAGNAAGTGARIALLNHAARLDICKLVRTIEKIETATEARFQEHFVEAMAFPHKTAPFPMLKTECALPEPVQTATKAPGSKRGRRRMKV